VRASSAGSTRAALIRRSISRSAGSQHHATRTRRRPRRSNAFWDQKNCNLKSAVQRVIDTMLAEKVQLGAMSGIIPRNHEK
jgi:hypothetical protein